MKQKHLYSLLDQTYTTIGVVFSGIYADPEPAAKAKTISRSNHPRPWASLEDLAANGWSSDGSRAYTYKVPKDAGIAVGDIVVVHNDRVGLKIANVVRVDETPQIDLDANFDYKWIVQKIDFANYTAKLESERWFANAMLEIERVQQKEAMLKGFRENLPEGSEARKLFDRTMATLASPTVAPSSPPPVQPREPGPAIAVGTHVRIVGGLQVGENGKVIEAPSSNGLYTVELVTGRSMGALFLASRHEIEPE